MIPSLPPSTVTRNWKVYDLADRGDHYSVLIDVDGLPTDTHETVDEFVTFADTFEGGVFSYITAAECKILRRGLVKRGDVFFDKDPSTGSKRVTA